MLKSAVNHNNWQLEKAAAVAVTAMSASVDKLIMDKTTQCHRVCESNELCVNARRERLKTTGIDVDGYMLISRRGERDRSNGGGGGSGGTVSLSTFLVPPEYVRFILLDFSYAVRVCVCVRVRRRCQSVF